MRRAFLASVLAAALLSGSAAQANDQDSLLRGTYSLTGSEMCIVSLTGFNSNLTAQTPFFFQNGSAIGTRVFNGDGTGSDATTTVTNNVVPTSSEGASSSLVTFNFTYTVASDHTVTVENDGALNGKELTGADAGDTFTIDTITQTGQLSQDRRSLTLATPTPAIETLKLSTGEVEFRICARSRILIKVSDETDSN